MSVPLNALAPDVIKKLPRYPVVPAALLGRLAIAKSTQGQGLGGALLADALTRTARAELGCGKPQGVPMAVHLSNDLEEVVVTAQKREAALSELGDYKLYSLPEKTHVNARQVKQVQLMDVERVPFQRVYSRVIAFEDLDTGTGPQPLRATSLIRIHNDKSSNLGKPIPAGAISVLDAGMNRAILAGESRLGDQPVGQPVDITLGEALDVWILPSAIQERECGFWRRRTTCADIDVTAINGKTVPITVELYLRASEEGDYSIASAPAGKRFNHGMPYWTVALGPGERKVLRYTVKETD